MNTAVSLFVGLLVLVASPSAQGVQPVRTTGPTYDGAIVVAATGRTSSARDTSESCCDWTPTTDQVREAEAVLAGYLASREAAPILRGTRIRSQLQVYKRQYWGETRGKRRQIRIWFYHEDTPVVKKGRWLKYTVSVAGGGDQYFQVTYDLNRRRFANLSVNAPE